MRYGLEGRVALITGGSKGIGLAIADALAQEGVDLAICARGAAELEKAAAALRARGGRVIAVPTDLTDPAAIERLVATTASALGRIDILVNNAVSSTQAPFDGLSDEAFRHHIDVKLLGYIRCVRATLPFLRASGSGRIVNLAGMTARIVGEHRMTNGVVNAGVTNFTKHLAQQVGRDGITVNAIHPGYTWTPRLETAFQRSAELENRSFEAVLAARSAEIPIGRLIQPADLAALALFLCSDLASAITGQAIAVDGGSGQSINY
jgi:NAD(P)-dependent dehydrogenase (short-subunit alcohol dehydrogenase family)